MIFFKTFLIGINCSDGFNLKNHWCQFQSRKPQMIASSLLQSAKTQPQKPSHILMPFKRA